MKRVLSIQDLSCVGRCSLTVALPVLSAMGLQCSVLPTAMLSTHTAFPDPKVIDATEYLMDFAEHWLENGVKFEVISVGYLSDPRQAEIVGQILEKFDCPVVLDPVMGDHGRLYRRITDAHIGAMKRLAARSDVLLPNLTEAAAMTGLPYREETDEAYLEELAGGLLRLGTNAVVVTGIHQRDGAIGFYGKAAAGESFSYQGQYIPRQCHGTGDLFAAVLTGSLTKGRSLPHAAKNAAEFVRACVEHTKEVTLWGVEFETQLYRLWEKAEG